MLATKPPAVLVFCGLWCLVLPFVTLNSLATVQESYKATKLPDYKSSQERNPHQQCLELVDNVERHRRKARIHPKRGLKIQSSSAVFQSLLLLLMYGALCVVCNIGVLVLLGVEVMTTDNFVNDQLESVQDFFPVRRLAILFVMATIVSLQSCALKTFNKPQKTSEINDEISSKRYSVPMTDLDTKANKCFGFLDILLMMCGDVELNPGPTPDETQQPTTGATATPGQTTEPSSDQATGATADQTNGIESVVRLETIAITNEKSHDKEKAKETVTVLEKPVNEEEVRTKVLSYPKQNDGSERRIEPVNSFPAENILKYYPKSWLKEGFKHTELNNPDITNILLEANKQFRSGNDYPLCIRCGREKVAKERKIRISHVFPESILRVYRDVHCGGDSNFIIDISKFIPKAGFSRKVNELGYPLQCSSCEQLGTSEEYLKAIYIFLLYETEKNILLKYYPKHVKKIKDGMLIKQQWFPFILANIMFRGLLVSSSLKTMLTTFKPEFIKLWLNALGEGEVSDLRLYILPAHGISQDHAHFHYTLEHLLRNPSMTEMCECDATGTFLHTSFDCLHLVLPLNDSSKRHFDDYNHVKIFEREILLKRCVYPTAYAIFDKDIEKDKTQAARFEHTDTRNCFPQILFTISAFKYEQWAIPLTAAIIPPNVPHIRNTRVMAKIHPDIHVRQDKSHGTERAESNKETVLFLTYKPETDDETKPETDEPYTNNTIKDLKNLKKFIESARKKSILAWPYLLEKKYEKSKLHLERLMIENKEKDDEINLHLNTIIDLKIDLSQYKQKWELIKKELRDKNTELEKLKEKLEYKNVRIARLEQENEDLKRKNQDLLQQVATLSNYQRAIENEKLIKNLEELNII